MKPDSFRIVQISDTHIFSEKDKSLLGVKTDESFNSVLKMLREDKSPPDIIIHSGDLSQDGTESSYVRVAEALKEFKVPVYCVPGNHDSSKMMARIYPLHTISSHKHIVLKDWHIILLDSHVNNAVEGNLGQSQLDYMRYCLEAYPQHQAIIVFHHHPILVGSAWLDNLNIQNADEFWDVISNYPTVNTILFGHVHQQIEGEKNGVRYFSTPSTCIQFKTKSDAFMLEKLSPGYRWIELDANGKLNTGVYRVINYVGTFEENAKGY